LPDGGIHRSLAALLSIKAGKGGLVTSLKGYTPFEFLQDIMRDPSLFDVAHSGRKISKAKEENHGIYEKKGPPHSNSCRFQFVKKEWPIAHGLIR